MDTNNVLPSLADLGLDRKNDINNNNKNDIRSNEQHTFVHTTANSVANNQAARLSSMQVLQNLQMMQNGNTEKTMGNFPFNFAPNQNESVNSISSISAESRKPSFLYNFPLPTVNNNNPIQNAYVLRNHQSLPRNFMLHNQMLAMGTSPPNKLKQEEKDAKMMPMYVQRERPHSVVGNVNYDDSILARNSKYKRRPSYVDTSLLYCHECGRRSTPEWRKGPDGPATLCNACGLQYAKKLKMIRLSDSVGLSGVYSRRRSSHRLRRSSPPVSDDSLPISQSTPTQCNPQMGQNFTNSFVPTTVGISSFNSLDVSLAFSQRVTNHLNLLDDAGSLEATAALAELSLSPAIHSKFNSEQSQLAATLFSSANSNANANINVGDSSNTSTPNDQYSNI